MNSCPSGAHITPREGSWVMAGRKRVRPAHLLCPMRPCGRVVQRADDALAREPDDPIP